MRKLLLSTATLFIFLAANTQNVGIGTNDPKTKLDINGALSARVTSLPAANSVTIPDNVTLFLLTPTAGGTPTALSLATPKEGQFLTIMNQDDNDATFNGYTIPAGTVSNPSVGNFINIGGVTSGWKSTSDNNTGSNAFTAGNGLSWSGNTLNSVWSKSGNDIYNNNPSGRVGIGTMSPSGTFEVDGGTAAANTHGTNITVKAQDGGTGSTAGGSITLTAGSGTLANGVVDINSSGKGNVNIADGTNAQTVNIATGAANKTVNIGSANTTSTTAINAGSGGVKVNTLTGGGLVKSDGTGKLSNGVTASDIPAGTVTADNGLTVNTGNNVRLGGTLATATTIDQNGKDFNFSGSGSVGIGTTPTVKLDVSGAVKTNNGFIANDGGTGAPSIRFAADANSGIYRPGANTMGFVINNTDKGRFNSTGLQLGTSNNNTGNLTLANSSNANTVSITSPAVTTTYSLTLPAAQGSNGQVLKNDGSGNLSWQNDNNGGGTVTNVTASAPLASTGGATPNITITQAGASSNGYLSSTDWNTFNNKPSGSGTVNYVPKWTGAGTLSSTSNIFDDGTNVGIGTTAPGNKLGIGIPTNDAIPALGANGGSFGIFKLDVPTGNYGFMMGVLGTGDVFQQAQRIDGTATAYNLLLQPNGGNVGIGTTSPNSLLQVGTNVSVGPVLTLGSQGTNYDALGTISTNEFAIQPYTYFHILRGYAYTPSNRKFNTSDYMMTISQNDINFSPPGNVGIGSTNQFQVNSSGNIIKLNNVTTSFPSSQGAANTILQNDGSGNLTWASPNALGTKKTLPDPGASAAWYKLGTWTTDQTQGARITFTVTGSAGYDPNSANSTGRTIININTANQSGNPNVNGYFYTEGGMPAILEVKCKQGANSRIWDVYAKVNYYTGNSFIEYTEGLNSSWVYNFTATSDPGVASSTIKVLDNRYSITSGNVGIGTTSPVSKLEVNGGDLNVSGQGRFKGWFTEGTGLAAEIGISSNQAYVISYDRTASVYSPINLSGSTVGIGHSGATDVFINSSGNVGVGTTNPSNYKLQVSGTLNAGYVLLGDNQNGNNNTVEFVTAPGSTTYGSGHIQYYSSGYLSLCHGGGNVGIGTTSPGQKLDVNGRIRIVDANSELYQETNRLKVRSENVDDVAQFANYGLYLPRTAQNFNLYMAKSMQLGYSESNPAIDYRNGDLHFDANGTERARVTAAGNVGIGTTSPTEALSVNGAVSSNPGTNQTFYSGGAITTANFQVKRDFACFNSMNNSTVPIHIKTNIPYDNSTNLMYRIEVKGYNYGASADLFSVAVGYSTKSQGGILNQQNVNYGSGATISQYASSDNYITIKLSNASSFYFVGFCVSAWLTNPNGNAFNIKALTIVQQNNNL